VGFRGTSNKKVYSIAIIRKENGEFVHLIKANIFLGSFLLQKFKLYKIMEKNPKHSKMPFYLTL